MRNNILNKSGLVVVFVLLSQAIDAQVMKFEVKAEKQDSIGLPFFVFLPGVNLNNDSISYVLVQQQDGESMEVPFQIEPHSPSKVWIRPQGSVPSTGVYQFELRVKNNRGSVSDELKVLTNDDRIKLEHNGQSILDYQIARAQVPDGVNELYGKSGYVHPLYSPKGNVLTTIQPDDHYHHYGLWQPWTRVGVREEVVDFWNLGDGKGTVRFDRINVSGSGALFGHFSVTQEHVSFMGAEEEVIIRENLSIKAFPLQLNGKTAWYLLQSSELTNVIEEEITLQAYRYGGGISIRTNEYWTNQNSYVLTSEGKTREDADGTYARWTTIGGSFDDNSASGILFLSHPTNRAHPEPMRVWPIDANDGRGDLFFEFCPIRHESWELAPLRNYTLNYGMIIFDGELSAELSEQIWQGFANGCYRQAIVKWSKE